MLRSVGTDGLASRRLALAGMKPGPLADVPPDVLSEKILREISASRKEFSVAGEKCIYDAASSGSLRSTIFLVMSSGIDGADPPSCAAHGRAFVRTAEREDAVGRISREASPGSDVELSARARVRTRDWRSAPDSRIRQPTSSRDARADFPQTVA